MGHRSEDADVERPGWEGVGSEGIVSSEMLEGGKALNAYQRCADIPLQPVQESNWRAIVSQWAMRAR